MNYHQKLKADELTIFLLHGVVKKSSYKIRNYTRKHIESDYFYKVLKSLKETGTPISLNEALNILENRHTFPENSFAITFDDGFENNYSVAAPILADLSIPATFYISTGMVDQNTMTWIDRIELCFEQHQTGKVKLPWEDTIREFNQFEDQVSILNEIRRHIKSHREVNQEEFVKYIYSLFKMEMIYSSNDPLDKKLSWQQVSELNSHTLFKVGGHAHNHEILSFLSSEELHKTIETSLTYLAQKASIKTIHYSYPEGLSNCYSEAVVSELKTFGIKICPTAIDGTNKNTADPFHLRRIFLI